MVIGFVVVLFRISFTKIISFILLDENKKIDTTERSKETSDVNKTKTSKVNNNSINNKNIQTANINKEELLKFVYDISSQNLTASSIKYALRNLKNDQKEKEEYLLVK